MSDNKIVFGTVDSSTYGIYISGEGVFNAPVRDAEMISIPGRNGSYLLDRGRFDNIEVRYPAFNKEADKATFIQKIDNFRNAIASLKGYQKLVDTFHSDEYRMGSFIGGLEVQPFLYNDHASQFELVFNCKPQRYLTSGETASTVANNGTITNPTLFPSKPLLAVKGYGTITMNGYEVNVNNLVLGNVILLEPFGGNPQTPTKVYSTGLVNTGDTITVATGSEININLKATSGYQLLGVMVTNNSSSVFSVTHSFSETVIPITVKFPAENFTAGTSKTVSGTFSVYVEYEDAGGVDQFQTITFTPTMTYNGANRSFNLSCSYNTAPSYGTLTRLCTMQRVSGNSTISGLGNPTYIDCDIGEAYKIVNNEMVSLNNIVEMGARLPELSPGNNTVTYPNTITELKITPRWWKI